MITARLHREYPLFVSMMTVSSPLTYASGVAKEQHQRVVNQLRNQELSNSIIKQIYPPHKAPLYDYQFYLSFNKWSPLKNMFSLRVDHIPY